MIAFSSVRRFENSRLARNNIGSPPGGSFSSIAGLGKYRRQLRVQTLRHSVANRFLRHRSEKPGGAPRVNEFNRVIENIQPRRLITQRKIAMDQQIRKRASLTAPR